ncbi:type 1 fimbrial protein [Stenotrophomonas maltophilia]|uniref:fimbrial protein n=1 Tax=Stenotrophomonas maltophilia TaxID=40324 RepID=UPI0015DE4AD9|nr:fimbrial protein [Stenotrophomonas maltophilia]MBA0386491.1 type 1 fimbrial protein [Stenotrophomonas maltophilia]MBA0391879.1 type 1 fimbrial protein [Stenotrophomonas maltophilia]MBA0464323.1 type 1 fimbrial protein [Stenotrophomonas maltophilia]MBA0471701.1 type 1 fimbrial protein [Stenotrophomonas maltophilia]
MMLRTQHQLGRKVTWLGAALLGFMCFQSPAVRAGTCSYVPEAPTFLQAVTSITGSITVGRDLPVGSEIYRATFNTNRLARVTCQPGTYTRTRRYINNPYPLSSYVHPTYGSRVYRTSVPGVGAVVWVAGNALPTTTTDVFNVHTELTAATAFDISLIKIGDVGAGTIRGSDLPTFEYVEIGDNTIRMLLGSFTGSLNIVSRTCSTPDVSVNLGTHQMSALSGVGTGTNWVNVPIRLNNCPGFYDAFRNNLTNDDGVTAPRRIANQIRYRVDPITSIVVPSQGVMALQPDGVNQTATGIGIQMGDANSNPITYGSNRASGLTLTQTENASYTFNLRARYYQTGATPTSGQANGAATVTLIYE